MFDEEEIDISVVKETIKNNKDTETYVIYAHINNINGKIYIGQTSKDPEIRWGHNGSGYLRKNSNGRYTQSRFAAAINKYGWNNFTHKIVAVTVSSTDADKIEQDLIKKYGTILKENGYNLAIGGIKNHSHTKETKEKISKSNLGRKITPEANEKRVNAIRGKKHTEGHNKKISKSTSKALKEKYRNDNEFRDKINKNLEKAKSAFNQIDTHGENNSFYGKTHTEEVKVKYLYRPVRCVTTGEEFKSIKEAAEKYNLKRTGITSACSGRYATCGGYEWEYIGEPSVPKNFKKNNVPTKKVMCVETGEIFKSIKSAAEKVGLFNGSLISHCCNGKKLTAKGYHWKYVD